MSRTVTVGLDGSPESRTAAEWAAREARLCGLPLRLVHVWVPVPVPMERNDTGVLPARGWDMIAPDTAEGLRLRHPGVEVVTEQRGGEPGEALVAAAEDAELLVLGSRGLSGVGGFLVGSVGQSVVARAGRPVVLVRAGEQAADEHETDPVGIPSTATRYRPVVLGLDIDAPDDAVLAFAFEEAARRGTVLRAVHAWTMPPYYAYGLAVDPAFQEELSAQVTAALRPWRQKYPSVEIVEVSAEGSASARLVDASHHASLVVVGRRTRRAPLGPHIGPVTHAVLHHSTAPVAVVPHD